MAKEKTCPKCQTPRAPGQSYCPEHYAEYMREYRPVASSQRDTQMRNDGFTSGVQACVRFLRSKVGGSALTGYQAAKELERHVVKADIDAMLIQRQNFIRGLRGM